MVQTVGLKPCDQGAGTRTIWRNDILKIIKYRYLQEIQREGGKEKEKNLMTFRNWKIWLSHHLYTFKTIVKTVAEVQKK